jgi:hypothetical protein
MSGLWLLLNLDAETEISVLPDQDSHKYLEADQRILRYKRGFVVQS